MVFQITFTRIATYIAQEIAYAVTCPLSNDRRYASLVVQIVQGISTAITVYAVIVFERRMNSILTNQGHRPTLKLVSFKLIVGLEAIQNILFPALGDDGIYFPTPPYHVSWSDFAIGIPQLILIVEMAIASVVFLWSFSFEEYKRLVIKGEPVRAPAWRAFFQTFDIRDVWQGVIYMFTAFTRSEYLEGPVDGRIVEQIPAAKRQDSKSQPFRFDGQGE